MKDSRQRNQLTKLVEDSGHVAESAEAMGRVATEYFTGLFASSANGDLDSLFNGFHGNVTEEMNAKLICEVTDTEIREAVFAIKASSAPGKKMV